MSALQAPIGLAFTMGDACGIGPEILVKLWAQALPTGLVIGSPEVMQRARSFVAPNWQGEPLPEIVALTHPAQWRELPEGVMGVWAPPGMPVGLLDAPIGQIDRRAGLAAAASIRAAVRLAQQGEVGAIVPRLAIARCGPDRTPPPTPAPLCAGVP